MQVGEFEATFRNVVLPMGLTIDSIAISGGRTELALDPFSIVPDRPSEMLIMVTGSSLAAFLTAKAPGGLKDFSVNLAGGKLRVAASIKMIFEVRAEAVCGLRLADGKELFVDLETLETVSGPKGIAPKSLVQGHLDQINPVIDLHTLPVTANIRSIKISDGAIVMAGELSPKP